MGIYEECNDILSDIKEVHYLNELFKKAIQNKDYTLADKINNKINNKIKIN